MPSRGHSPLVYVIVVTFNGREHLARFVPSLSRTAYNNYKTILVDNGSHDGSAEFAKGQLADLEVIASPGNVGFARGNNLAIQVALHRGAEYLALLNDDTELLDEQWLNKAITAMNDHPDAGILGFDIVEEDRVATPTSDRPSIQEAQNLTGCALIVRANLFKQIGLFDEKYFAYSEEDDLELRAKRAGFRLIKLNVPIYHRSGGTSRRFPVRTQYLVIRNAIRCSIKNRSPIKTLARIARFFDICCNPRPRFMSPDDVAHLRARGNGNLFMNGLVLLAALGWNLLFLPQTLLIATKDRERIRKAGLMRNAL